MEVRARGVRADHREHREVRKGRDDTAGSPHRARISQLELLELILLLKFDKQFPVEQLEATVSQSTVPSPHLKGPQRTCCGKAGSPAREVPYGDRHPEMHAG